MTEADWLACEDPALMESTLQGPESTRKRRLLVVACAHLIWERIPEGDMRDAVNTAEAFADGLASQEELASASNAMYRYIHGRADPEDRKWGLGGGDKQSIHRHCLAAVLSSGGMSNLFTMNGWVDCRKLTGQFQPALLRDIFGNPFRAAAFDPEWRTDTVRALAAEMYESRDFSAMPILADALQDAGCDNADILDHCRGDGPHVRGCWVVDLVLGLS